MAKESRRNGGGIGGGFLGRLKPKTVRAVGNPTQEIEPTPVPEVEDEEATILAMKRDLITAQLLQQPALKQYYDSVLLQRMLPPIYAVASLNPYTYAASTMNFTSDWARREPLFSQQTPSGYSPLQIQQWVQGGFISQQKARELLDTNEDLTQRILAAREQVARAILPLGFKWEDNNLDNRLNWYQDLYITSPEGWANSVIMDAYRVKYQEDKKEYLGVPPGMSPQASPDLYPPTRPLTDDELRRLVGESLTRTLDREEDRLLGIDDPPESPKPEPTPPRRLVVLDPTIKLETSWKNHRRRLED